MLGNLVNLVYRGLSIRRWNNYPRIEEFVENEHISLKLNLAYILSEILEEKGQKIDLYYIYQQIFWSSFFTFIYSDIKFDVKSYLKKHNKDIYFTLWKQIFEFFNSLNLAEEIKADFNEFYSYFGANLFEPKKEKENDLIKLIKLLEIKFEIKNNLRFYPEIYKPIYDGISNSIYALLEEFSLLDDIKAVENYLNFLIRLKFAYRWNRMKRDYPVSVLAHLYLVFVFSYFFGILKKLSVEERLELLNRSLLHDLPEALTGDVITPTKRAAKGFSQVLEKIEEDLVEKNIISIFSNYKFKEQLKGFTLYPFENNIGKIAKMSDNLSAMFEAKIENKESFKRIYLDIKKYLWTLEDRELDYILKYGVDYFDEDVEIKWKSFIGI